MNAPGESDLISLEELASVLRECRFDRITVLVGGQAVAFWAQNYDLIPPDVLSAGFSRDIDFLGDSDDAIALSEALGGEVILPAPFDPSVSSGKVLVRPFGEHEALKIDFVYQVLGLSEHDIRNQAVQIGDAENHVFVIHPIHCLESKLNNLRLPEKQFAESLEQLKMAIEICTAHINRDLRGDRKALRLIERVGEICKAGAGKDAYFQHGIDIATIIRDATVDCDPFHEKRKDQLLQEIATARARHLTNYRDHVLKNEDLTDARVSARMRVQWPSLRTQNDAQRPRAG